jgi:hypothetical protein
MRNELLLITLPDNDFVGRNVVETIMTNFDKLHDLHDDIKDLLLKLADDKYTGSGKIAEMLRLAKILSPELRNELILKLAENNRLYRHS